MKPTLESLRAACPDIDPGNLDEHLTRLGDRYFQHFPAEAVCEHVRRLARLSPRRPVEVLLAETQAGSTECTVLGFDHPGVFALITGVFTGLGYDIASGAVFTYRRRQAGGGPPRGERPPRRSPPGADPLQRRRIINHFSGVVQRRRPFAAWSGDLRCRLEEVFRLLEKGDPGSAEEARNQVNEQVVRRLARLDLDSLPVLYPVTIEVDNTDPEVTRLRIVSEDTPAFLYSLTHALSLQGIQIEQVRISTVAGRIEDEIDVVDRNHRKIEEPRELSRLQLSALLTKQFTYFLGRAPEPYAALGRFRHLVEDILNLPGRDEWVRLLNDPNALQDLAVLLGTSSFLWEDFIRLHVESLLPLLAPMVKGKRFSQPEETLPARIQEALAGARTLEEQAERLNRFKNQEIYSIDLDHLLSPELGFSWLAARLTGLAEQVVNAAMDLGRDHLLRRFGRPQTSAGLEARHAILGLGKLGGADLGYASDIEFVLVYGDNGQTAGPEPVPNAEFFNRLVATAARLIQAKREGIFQVDLRLRPHGSAGPLACSLEAFCDYYGRGGTAHSFERLALVRLRAIGGDPELGARLERIREEIVYASPDIRVEELRELRERQFREKTSPGRRNAKFSAGGLVDLEYNVQILQVRFGGNNEALRTPRMLKALEALADAGVLTPEETGRLFSAYGFLRVLINAMRMLRGSARDLELPAAESPEFVHLARRMGYGSGGSLGPALQLDLDYETHTAAVRAFAERFFGREALPGPTMGTVADLVLAETVPADLAAALLSRAGFRQPERAYTNLRELAGTGSRRSAFARLSLLAADVLARTPDPDMALNNWERFIRSLTSPEYHYRLLMEQPRQLEVLLKLFAGSQFLADTLIRYPGFLDWLMTPENLHCADSRQALAEELSLPAYQPEEHGAWLNQLRRLRRREILRIGTRDLVLQAPTEEVMRELSVLAEALAGAALEGVYTRLRRGGGLTAAAGRVEEGFCLLAFGKLGGAELNYSSDIDLLGLCAADPDDGGAAGADPAGSRGFYAGVMERLALDLSRHTEEGYAYRVDLRLRPYGRAGELVPCLGGLVEYYRREASLWEIQAALKIRPIAGNLRLGEEFLRAIRPVLLTRRRPGTIVESVERMRQAAMRKPAPSAGQVLDVKSGAGGIRDVEFLVQGLQLMNAPDQPQLLRPGTLDALQALGEAGLLGESRLTQLREDYLFLRRVEHFLQILEDRQTHALPRDPEELGALARRLLGVEATAERFLEVFRECCGRVREAYVSELLGRG